MTYVIAGLPRAAFEPFFASTDAELTARQARRVVSDGQGLPCRVSLEDVPAGKPAILLNFVSHDVSGPFRTAYAIYVGEEAQEAEPHHGRVPLYLDKRSLSLRGFGADGTLKAAALSQPGEADKSLRTLFDRDDVAYVHAHNAAYGCFLAQAIRG